MALRSTLLMTRDPSKCSVDGVAKQMTTALEIRRLTEPETLETPRATGAPPQPPQRETLSAMGLPIEVVTRVDRLL
jgi:hypothetical protein